MSSGSSQRHRRVFILLLACGVLWSIEYLWRRTMPSRSATHHVGEPVEASLSVRPASLRRDPRTVFAHSVISGGVRSADELTHALRTDPVAAAHYAHFRADAAHLDYLKSSTRAYVSFRTGAAIYWTRHRVSLPEGEAVLTDGENVVRARCGNRISFTPRQPTGPDVDLDVVEPAAPADAIPDAGAPDIFDLPLLVHEIFPPYFEGFGGLSTASLPAGSALTAGSPGYVRGFGSTGTGGISPLLQGSIPSGSPGNNEPGQVNTPGAPSFAFLPTFSPPFPAFVWPGSGMLPVSMLPPVGPVLPPAAGSPPGSVTPPRPTSGGGGSTGNPLPAPPSIPPGAETGDAPPESPGPPLSFTATPFEFTPPVIETPEPSTALLVVFALAIFFVLRAR
jgi:hypothetical protein